MRLSNQAFQCHTAVHSVTTAMIGLDTGITMCRRIVITPPPSIFTDSSRDSGSVMKKFRAMIIVNVGTSSTSTSAQIVLIMPRRTTSKYRGMSPPVKNIVKTTTPVQNVRLGKYFLESGYAVRMTATSVRLVPTTTRAMVFTHPEP